MLRLSLEEIREEHLRNLSRDQILESIRLEFKRELNLDSAKEKAEAAKDVSALAKTDGGRLLYGVDETTLADGSTVASSICPLTDGSIDSRLTDVLLSSMHPRPKFRTLKVAVDGGFVLVVEAYPGFGNDLYMVTGFKELRSYVRIASSHSSLEQALERAVSEELSAVEKTNRVRNRSTLVRS